MGASQLRGLRKAQSMHHRSLHARRRSLAGRRNLPRRDGQLRHCPVRGRFVEPGPLEVPVCDPGKGPRPPLVLDALERSPGPDPSDHWNTSTVIAALDHDRTDAPGAFDGPVNDEVFLA